MGQIRAMVKGGGKIERDTTVAIGQIRQNRIHGLFADIDHALLPSPGDTGLAVVHIAGPHGHDCSRVSKVSLATAPDLMNPGFDDTEHVGVMGMGLEALFLIGRVQGFHVKQIALPVQRSLV